MSLEYLSKVDLIVDQIFEGGRNGNSSDDPLPHLLGVDNAAGFRHLGKRPETETIKMLVLKSNFNDSDWPDQLNRETGILTYYGDNKKVGDLHNTPRQGNLILKNLFNNSHDNSFTEHFPAIFVFGGTGNYRDVRFLGLAVPGSETTQQDEDLVAIWRTKGHQNQRFQNYKSVFTILDVPIISRNWINDIKEGNVANSIHTPAIWLNWLKKRKYTPLIAPKTIEIRSSKNQLPNKIIDNQILSLVFNKFKNDSYGFEKCAIKIAKLMMPAISSIEITRPSRDGGRDAIGKYKIGKDDSAVDVEFALEAKCYNINNSVGVKEISRLISRLRHRQFGILVTTSFVGNQAYKEIKEDQHPIVIISGIDIIKLLKKHIGDLHSIKKWIS